MSVAVVFVWPPRVLVPMLAVAHAVFATLMVAEPDQWLQRVGAPEPANRVTF